MSDATTDPTTAPTTDPTTDPGSTVRYGKDADGIVTLTLDDPNARANTMNAKFAADLAAALDRLERDIAGGGVVGAVVASAKSTFVAGADLNELLAIGPDQAEQAFETSMALKRLLRRLETCGVPVVAAINGAALGGGLELCLACHRRIAVDAPSVQIGFPEVTLGLLPGAGGVVRTVRMMGILSALLEVLVNGTRFRPAQALEKGLVDQLVPTADELAPAARQWLLEHRDDPDAAVQPWDRKGYKLPGGAPSHPSMAAILPAVPAMLRKQLKGVALPAPRAIVAAAVEGAQVDFSTAERIEARYFTSLATGRVSKAMIQAFFFDMQALNAGSLRPQGPEKFTAQRLAVLGAGMMGAGIAYSAAKAGVEVVLKDVSLEAAERGKAYSERLVGKAVSRGRMAEEAAAALLARITPTDNVEDLKGCDSVIEAVFEDPALKHQVFGEIQHAVNPDALLGSNTSTLPITQLAEGVDRPEDFIGIHFFSPADKMPIVEIIKGEKTSDETLARTVDLVLQIKKIPIVVNDSRGFYTSRVIGLMVNEGLAMLGEGVAPMSIERATTMAGYPVGVLQLSDELNLELMAKIEKATREGLTAEGKTFVEQTTTAPQHPQRDARAGDPGRAGSG